VAAATLELAERPLHQEILQLVANSSAPSIDRVVVLPLFLLPGVHVMEDIPQEVDLARATLGDRVELKIAPYLGSHPEFYRFLLPQRQNLPAHTILLAHGSRRAGGNQIVEQIAQNLSVRDAYWSVAPSLADRVAELVSQGATEIGIFPYFLFPGAITDEIASLVEELRQQFPQTRLLLGETIGSPPLLVTAIGQILDAL
jgi:sirohydrochlorin cobaltochelatase